MRRLSLADRQRFVAMDRLIARCEELAAFFDALAAYEAWLRRGAVRFIQPPAGLVRSMPAGSV
jgi:hypothetical protein